MVAEGVETLAQLETLKSLGCDQYQGFHFSPALPPDQFQQLLLGRDVAAETVIRRQLRSSGG